MEVLYDNEKKVVRGLLAWPMSQRQLRCIHKTTKRRVMAFGAISDLIY